MTFRVGQKVVCVNDKPVGRGQFMRDTPVKGTVYTIAGFSSVENDDDLYVVLDEIKNAHCGQDGYAAWRFRPIVERKTDISVFTEILRKATKPARTPAMSQQERQ